MTMNAMPPDSHTHALLIVNGQGDVRTHMTGSKLDCTVRGMSVANGWCTYSVVELPVAAEREVEFLK